MGVRVSSTHLSQTSRASKRTNPASGFSLVEVVLSIGVIAFAFVGIFALLPAGMGLFHQAVDASTSADIAQRITSDAEQTEFSELLNNPASGAYFVMPIRYFDDQGTEIKVQNPAAPSAGELAKVLYWARVRGSLPGNPDPTTHTDDYFTSLPSTNGQRFNPRATTYLTIQIVTNPSGSDLGRLVNSDDLIDGTKASAANIPLQTYTAVVSRNGY